MLNSIIHFSIKHKVIVALMTLALVVWGIWSATKLPIDAVPDITNNQVQIITICPTLAGQEVEQFVTYPVEQALANLPDIEELRSISRFGLSLITVVFDDNVNIWFARQLVGEKLREAVEQIPPGVGTPELAPVSTGLGEIYQYVIHPKPGSEDKYNAMDLRTMQDWIVARQLYGTPGVAEVNSFGGVLKQYEVAVSPDRLRAMNVTIPEIFNALQENNENTGGAYIDKKPNAFFIRGIGLVTSLEDVKKIVVKTGSNGIPLLIGDIAEVRFGNAVRYGALTFNGEKEVVGGIVMMLKGENSAEVVQRVKAKMISIQKSLPEDVIIEPFLDRTDLVKRAIKTVETNLVEGALIVIFVLVVFLGNLRAGLIVASAIPLSMLFALGMMNVFGVSANLMSLGAIDFGLIVDGAVIIVEATMHAIGLRKQPNEMYRLAQGEMDHVVEGSTKKMMNSAAFGQIIILIVYLPILSLEGIEGKMFGPMAQTVGFAIFGALILSLTYIPMMCAQFLPKRVYHVPNFSDKMMSYIQRIYSPALRGAIRVKYFIVTLAAGAFAVSVFLFARIGGEFIPQLQEGDFAFHCILPMGSSLSQSIETSMQVERILMEFPEVKMIIGKTGSAEVPIDPMPPEVTDMMIILKHKDEWVTTDDYNELAGMMLERLETIPGIFFEANQPIQMRFNELMTGIRQDVAVKVFGEDIDTLAAIAPKIATIVKGIAGTTDPQVERTIGLPQITIQYDRNRLANYGINVEEVNHTVSTAFAGEKAGVVFENERKFDLVVRLDSAHRASFEDVSELLVATPTGNQIPLSQVATVAFKQGPAQISRDDGRRRIVIGFNIKGRDVQSVVKEIEQKLENSVQLPPGYYYTFGGTFENLEKANARLLIAVPVALFLIFVLLFFTFNSLGQAALIYTAIPMSAIGGVFALMFRGMPFSISAGVGFIALFGVAVLNGIVLIATFNQLKNEGVADVYQRVLKGTQIRLRPVLMTAAVASLGFLPMALSTGAGAEVQKPLATVVIGGLITATLLTLIVLPLLYIIFSKFGKRNPRNPTGHIRLGSAAILLCISFAHVSNAQSDGERITLGEAIQITYENNLLLKSDQLNSDKSRVLTSTWFEVPKTGIFVENEDFSSEDENGIWKIGISQSLASPGFYKANRELLRKQVQLSESQVAVTMALLKHDLTTSYYQLWYLEEKRRLFQTLDSLYTILSSAVALRVRAGESAGLEQIASNARLLEVKMQLGQFDNDIAIEQEALMRILNTDVRYLPEQKTLEKIPLSDPIPNAERHPLLLQQEEQVKVANATILLNRKARLPEFSGRLFSQRLLGLDAPVSGFSVTASFPLLGKYLNARVQAAELESRIQQQILEITSKNIDIAVLQRIQGVRKSEETLRFYETTGLRQADEIILSATQAYESGEIGFVEVSQFLTQAISIRQNYLDAVHNYNLAVIEYNYYINN